jgi:hypothetical protein
MIYKALFIKKINKMNQDKSNAYATVINYHFYINLDDVSKFQEIEKIFHPLTENHSVTKTFLISNKKQKNKIIIGDKDEELTKNSNNIEANEEKSSLNEENGENINNYVEAPKEQISIEIPELENNFLNKKRYFEVDRKKTGRKPKDSNSKSYHTKYSHDNILRKIKVKFFQKFMKYVNRKIESKYNGIIQKILPLKGEISQNNTIKFNTQFLNTKLKDIFSNTEFNGKFSSYGENYNKNVIDTIYNNNIRELIEIFELTFLEMFNIFKNTNDTRFNDFEKLNTVVKELKLKENDNYYADLFQNTAMNFENYYFKKTPRK